jgi:hypothetical protein
MKSFQFAVFSVVTAGALAASAFGQATTSKTISQLPAATNVADADLTIIVQGGITKRATAALIRAGITGGTSDWNALSNRPSWITGATWQTNATAAEAADELGVGPYDSPQFSRVYLGGTNASVTSTGWSYEGTNSGGFNIGVVNNGVVDVGFGISTNQLLVFSNSILFRGSQSWGTNEAHLALTRSNLRIPWSGVTNTNAAGWRADLGLGGWTTNASLTASLISDFSNSVVAVAPASTNASALTAGTLPDARLSTNVVTRNTNGVAQASAWTLLTAPTNGVATIQTNQFGVGWDDMGRFAVMTPVGPLVMYATGDPLTPTIWWGGRIVSQEFSAITVNGAVYARNIVGGASGGSIANSVMRESMPEVLRNFMGGDGAAGAVGVPYILTNGSMQPLPGTYVPFSTVITNGSGNLELTGRYAEINAFRTNVFQGGGVPAAGAPEGADYKAIAGQGTWVASPIYFTRQATNSPQTTNSTAVITNGVTMTISNVPSGTYTVDGLVLSDSSASREWALIAPNNTVNPRALLGWFGSGSASGFFGSATNMISNADASTGQRTLAVRGMLVLTNTGSVTLTVRISSGGTNFIQMLQDSFLRLMKVN